jgi:hypothetical protein
MGKQLGTKNRELISPATLTVEARKKAAAHRLQIVRTEQEHMEALREITANLIGSEQMAVYQVERSCCTLRWQFGLDAKPRHLLPFAQEEHIKKAAEGILVSAGTAGEMPCIGDLPVQALIPIRLHNGSGGVLVLFALLQQKKSLDASDRELFELFMR